MKESQEQNDKVFINPAIVDKELCPVLKRMDTLFYKQNHFINFLKKPRHLRALLLWAGY